jgi:hypothetical protein
MLPLLVLVGLVAATGCGSGSGDFDMSVRRVALSLAFADADKAEPVKPRVVFRLIPAPPEALGGPVDRIPLSFPAKCPAAPNGAPVVDQASYGIAAPPAMGTFKRHNAGSLTLQGAVPVKVPFPRKTSWELTGLHAVQVPVGPDDPTQPGAGAADSLNRFPPGEGAGAPQWEYSVRKTLTPQFSITDTYRLTQRRLLLLKRETKTQDGTISFVPDPPITFLEHADGEGNTWRSAGVDQKSGTAMVIDGRVDKRESIDVCGTLHDAYRVVVNERTVNLATGETSGTADGDPNVYDVATQLGGLVLKEDLQFTQTITTPEGTAIVEWDYQSTQDSAAPETQ